MKAIGTFPFTEYSVKIVGFKLKGVIFLMVVGADDEEEETEADYARDYMGHKFEQYMTSKEPGVGLAFTRNRPYLANKIKRK